MNTYQTKTVRDIAIENPGATRVFEALGIDYCCGGKKPLTEACERANVRVDHVLEMLEEAGKEAAPQKDWGTGPAGELIEHIVTAHHGYIRRETPRITALLEKVVARHGQSHPEVIQMAPLFQALTDELLSHAMKEEHMLFPFIDRLEKAGGQTVAAPFGTVANPIARMLAEHDDAGALVAEIRNLASDYQPPADACPTYRALYAGLDEFERDLHQHIHLENNILFPAAEEMEKKAAVAANA